ncbi:hypothetical protein [Phenylobacterium sp.]|uniref:hypothetical protein n=1 Tax=Phenylobacterium sp. TaxID=1871053 RepID=UPI002810D30F|nr:hypothetical protein [Phenylobacterium sp.]
MKTINRLGIAALKSIAAKPIATRDATRPTPSPNQYTPGTYSFRPLQSGYWKFVLWGGGANGGASSWGGGSGAYCEKTVFLTTSQAVALNVGARASATTATMPDGTIVSAGGAIGQSGGTAWGGDVNLNGSPGGSGSSSGAAGSGTGGGGGGSKDTNNGGAGAPANLPFRGGAGGTGSNTPDPGTSPGGGGGDAGSGAGVGGNGLAIVLFVRP